MKSKVIESTELFASGNASVITYMPNAHAYNCISIKSIVFINSSGEQVQATTGTISAFEITDSENISIKGSWPWQLNTSPELFDSISIAQFNGMNGHFFSYSAPPDFLGIDFVGFGEEVASVRVRWLAI